VVPNPHEKNGFKSCTLSPHVKFLG
jgi:hypothetical protein